MALVLDQPQEIITESGSLTDWMKNEGIPIPPYFSSYRTPTAWNFFSKLRRQKETTKQQEEQQSEPCARTAA